MPYVSAKLSLLLFNISFSTFCQIMELRWHIPRAFCNELDKATAISSVIQNALGHFVYRYVEEF
jgi:hypothetical protein